MREVVLKVHHIPIPELIQLAKMVRSRFIEHADVFPNPPISLPSLKQEIEALASCEQEMIARNYSKKLERDSHAAAVVSDLKLLRIYVSQVANGNETIINMAGMGLKRPSTSTSHTPPISILSLTPLKEAGAIRIMIKKERLHRGIIVEINRDLHGGGEWKEVSTHSESNIKIRGLTSGELVWVRVRAIATRGRMTDWTAPQSVRVT
ncbi:MAG TPA: hypothetical protein VL093_11360 [Flavipsychrobacter sp.]|nr:hypothetical protein [Flavipsychrobacter sp.]